MLPLPMLDAPYACHAAIGALLSCCRYDIKLPCHAASAAITLLRDTPFAPYMPYADTPCHYCYDKALPLYVTLLIDITPLRYIRCL